MTDKVFSPGEVLTAADVNNYLLNKTGSGNAIINGAFDIWQRGTSFTGLVYNADRWRSGSSIVRTTDVPTTEFQYSLKLNSSSTFAVLNQRIESSNSLIFSTTPFVLSFWIKANAEAIANGTVQTYYPNAVDNWSAKTFVDNTPLSSQGLTAGVWKRLSLPFGNNANFVNGLGIEVFGQTTTTEAVEFFITGVQVEAGSVATPFKRNANSLQGELAACQRYYYRQVATGTTGPFGVGFSDSTTRASIMTTFPVQMRVRPTALETSGTASNYAIRRVGGGTTALSVIPVFFGSSSLTTAGMDCDVASGLTAGDGVILRANSVDTAFLGWSAEL